MEASLTYRPTSMQLLCGAVAILQRNERLDRYKGDLLWRIAQKMPKNEDLAPYSEYMDILDGKKQYQTSKQKAQTAVNNMINMFLPQKTEGV